MTKLSLAFWLLSVIMIASGCTTTPTATDIPRLEERDGMKKLIVDGHPFICVAGEVSNTASSDSVKMKRTIKRLTEANLNTILTVVSWDLVEPEEGKFDFSWIDYQIEAARANNVRLPEVKPAESGKRCSERISHVRQMILPFQITECVRYGLQMLNF